MKKVLIITYYWPPAGGPGVQRVLKFVKYLPDFGYSPVVYTVENGEYMALDESLLREIPPEVPVFRKNIWEPTRLYKKLVGLPENAPLPVGAASEETDSLKKRISAWIRLNCFIPDAKLSIPFQMFALGKQIIREHQPDVVFSSGPPHSLHLLAYRLKKWSGLPWVADFRDPWTNIFYYKDQKRFFISKKIDRYLEKKVLNQADQCVTVGHQCALELHSKEYNLDFQIIYNGYDEQDFEQVNGKLSQQWFYITFTGNMNQYRNPEVLWKDLVTLQEQGDEILRYLKIRLIGVVHPKIEESIRNMGIQEYVIMEGYKPHREAVRALKESAILLLPISRSRGNVMNVTGKLFEYLAAQRYILSIGPKEGEAARIIRETGSGEVIDYTESVIPFLKKVFTQWKDQTYHLNNTDRIRAFSRKAETGQLAQTFDQAIGSVK
jgi:hypothetical protein